MALDELYGMGFKEYYLFEKRFMSVKASDLHRVAKKYFAKKKGVTITAVVGPAVTAQAQAAE